jgi:predicted DNA-binding transcriptional regulator AlpA
MTHETRKPVQSFSPERVASAPAGDLIAGWAGICAEVPKSRVQLWRDIRAGLFPAPIETGPNSVAWFRSEVEDWKRSRPRRTYRAPIGEGTDARMIAPVADELPQTGKPNNTYQEDPTITSRGQRNPPPRGKGLPRSAVA